MGCIDMNTWYSRVDRPDRPDWVLFDLDPSPDVGFEEVVEVALLVKQALDALGLEGSRRRAAARDARPRADRAAARLRRRARVRGDRRGRARRAHRASRRPNGRRRSAAACSSTRTRTARARRPRPSTRCARDRERRFRRRCAGTRSHRDSIHSASRWTSSSRRVAKDGDLFARVLEGGQSLGAALRSVG